VRRSNCLVFAARAWWRWRKQGAYFALRRSRHISGLHWLVNHRGRWVHFEPVRPKAAWWLAVFDKLYYRGRIRRSDSPH